MYTFDRIIFFSALLGLCGVSLVDGARNPIVYLPFTSFFLALLAIWFVFCNKLINQYKIHIKFRWVWIPWSAWLALTWLQAYGLAGVYSDDPYQSWLRLYLYLGYFGVMMLFTLLLRTRARITILIGAIVAIAVIQTLFGIINFYSRFEVFGWVPTHYAFIRVTGTFVNRNMFANYVAMSSCFALVWLFVSPATKPTRYSSSNHNPSLEEYGFRITCWLAIFILLAGILLSGSRGVMVSYITASIVLLIFVSLDSRISLYFRRLIFLVPAVGIFIGAKLIGHRVLNLLVESSDRLIQWKITLALIQDAVFVGHGAGTYESIFRTRQLEGLGPLIYNHAHNDYLELLVEQGVIGLLLPGFILLIIIHKAVNRLFSTKNIFRKKLILSCLFAVSVIFVHAFFDFPFQIPSNVWLYVVILAIMINASTIKLNKKSPD